jgi:hypothetical protein
MCDTMPLLPSPMDTLQLERFIQDTPPNALALFSAAKRSVGQQPQPNARNVEAGFNMDSVAEKAESLINNFRRISDGVHRPLYWQELYLYFDAIDIKIEGPAYLFYVLCHISKINSNRFVEIEQFSRMWISRNTERVICMPKSRDVIDCLTLEDQEWFGLGPFGRDSLTNWYHPILVHTLNALRSEFQHAAETARAVRKAAFINPPVLCSESSQNTSTRPLEPELFSKPLLSFVPMEPRCKLYLATNLSSRRFYSSCVSIEIIPQVLQRSRTL